MAEAVKAEFVYPPLKAETSIRLIRLAQSSTSDSNVVPQFELHEFDINSDDLPAYTALSYRWEDPSKTHIVEIRGCKLALHKNLFQFLKQVQLERSHDYYWTDAICIDQSNLQERNSQVSQMYKVYSQARRVLVWLGVAVGIDYALNIINHAAENDGVFEDEDAIVGAKLVADACSSVLSLSYWERAWISQELILAQELIVKSGACEIPFHLLQTECAKSQALWPTDEASKDPKSQNLQQVKNNLGARVSRAWNLLFNIKRLSADRLARKSSKTTPDLRLEDLLNTRKEVKCSDDRDRIYSLLGIYQERYPEAQLMPINYSRPVVLVYWDMVFMLLHNMKLPADPHETAVTTKLAPLLDLLEMNAIFFFPGRENPRRRDATILLDYAREQGTPPEYRALAWYMYHVAIALATYDFIALPSKLDNRQDTSAGLSATAGILSRTEDTSVIATSKLLAMRLGTTMYIEIDTSSVEEVGQRTRSSFILHQTKIRRWRIPGLTVPLLWHCAVCRASQIETGYALIEKQCRNCTSIRAKLTEKAAVIQKLPAKSFLSNINGNIESGRLASRASVVHSSVGGCVRFDKINFSLSIGPNCFKLLVGRKPVLSTRIRNADNIEHISVIWVPVDSKWGLVSELSSQVSSSISKTRGSSATTINDYLHFAAISLRDKTTVFCSLHTLSYFVRYYRNHDQAKKSASCQEIYDQLFRARMMSNDFLVTTDRRSMPLDSRKTSTPETPPSTSQDAHPKPSDPTSSTPSPSA